MTTQKAFANYQEIIDFHTESNTTSVIGIHTPCTDRPVKMLRGFWEQFKKVKYIGCDLAVVPAAQLPADPLQVSYGSGDPNIDPREMLNPLMFKGCHGNDLGVILNQIYSSLPNSTLSDSSKYAIMQRMGNSDSVEQNRFSSDQVGNDWIEALYYRCLTDDTWMKAHPQRGFRKKGLVPRVYSVATNHQYAFVNPAEQSAGNGTLPPSIDQAFTSRTGTLGVNDVSLQDTSNPVEARIAPGVPRFETSSLKYNFQNDPTQNYFFTPRTQRLGWLDTRAQIGTRAMGYTEALNGVSSHDSPIIDKMWVDNQTAPIALPKIFMGMIMCSPSYKTEMYYRLVLNHHFAFAGFRGAGEFLDNYGDANDVGAYNNFNE